MKEFSYEEVEAAMGGPLRLAALTGCRAHHRCTGPQIRKMHQTRPRVYGATERVSLVSSFMASLLIGGYACIDETDAAGMNIMDIATRQLRHDALQVLFFILFASRNVQDSEFQASYFSIFVLSLSKHFTLQTYNLATVDCNCILTKKMLRRILGLRSIKKSWYFDVVGYGSKFRREDWETGTSSCCGWKNISLFCSEVIKCAFRDAVV